MTLPQGAKDKDMAITLAWDPRFEIGHERVDFEHRIFLGLIRDLSAQSEAGVSRLRIEQTLREIYKYADFHFTSEENIMSDIGYPSLAAHREIHTMLLAQLSDAIHRYHNNEGAPADIVTFLFEWFALHTTRDDRRIAGFIAGSAAG